MGTGTCFIPSLFPAWHQCCYSWQARNGDEGIFLPGFDNKVYSFPGCVDSSLSDIRICGNFAPRVIVRNWVNHCLLDRGSLAETHASCVHASFSLWGEGHGAWLYHPHPLQDLNFQKSFQTLIGRVRSWEATVSRTAGSCPQKARSVYNKSNGKCITIHMVVVYKQAFQLGFFLSLLGYKENITSAKRESSFWSVSC